MTLGPGIPCYTIPPPPFTLSVPSSFATASAIVSTTVILDKVFTFKYALQPETVRNGLSTRQKIGIGVGIAVFVLLVLILAVFMLWRKGRKSSAGTANLHASSEYVSHPAAELEGKANMQNRQHGAELEAE